MRHHPQAFLCLWVVLLVSSVAWGQLAPTTGHESGHCALRGICGHRSDGDVLPCVNYTQATPLPPSAAAKLGVICPQLASEAAGGDAAYCCTEEQIDTLAKQIQIAEIFLVGCPACAHNFKHFFCLLACSPDQATFTNVTATQIASDTNATVVKEVEHFVTDAFGTAMFDSCKDVVYPVMTQRAMKFVGGGATNFQEWFDFLGLVKDKRFPPSGSPFQIDFPGEAHTPEGMRTMNDTIPSCADPGFACSCGDCTSAAGCKPPPPEPEPVPPGCPTLHIPFLRCTDITALLLFLALLACVPFLFRRLSDEEDAAHHQTLPGYVPGRGKQVIQLPASEVLLRKWYFKQGLWCARNPMMTLGVCCAVVAVCLLGLLRLRVETDPVHLWVGASSRAAQEKADYEASFGPFYRIEQLIVSTKDPGAPIVTDANIKLLFEMQAQIDALAARVPAADGVGRTVSLQDVCVKPLGKTCVMLSMLQYWKMDQSVYEKGSPPFFSRITPEFCFSHWSTQCRAAFGAPVDPHIVLGGFPTDSSFRNFSADATAFVSTFPLNSAPENREAALAWEREFVALARGNLTRLAEGADLRLSFSAERSVADELARESGADATTVAASYAAMLAYIALALGSVPRRSRGRWREALVRARVSLGLGGVLIVAAAAAGAIGVCSLIGLRSSLILLEVIPFLVLAVGVDNMFILAHALDAQPLSLPREHRVARALASAGPSITLAATCEFVAFAIGGMTSMPALRTFSICAAIAILLDFLLQVTAFVALLSLDAERMEQGRVDCFPCVRLAASPIVYSMSDSGADTDADDSGFYSGDDDDTDGWEDVAPTLHPPEQQEAAGHASRADGYESLPDGHGTGRRRAGRSARLQGYSVTSALRWYMATVHVPTLMRPRVQTGVIVALVGAALLSLAMLPRVERGLDQSVALSRDSYLQPYFKDVYAVLRVGPPVMLVVKRANVSTAAPDVNRICSVAGCEPESLLNRVGRASRTPHASYVATPAASWLDDFLTWISPDIPQCCRMYVNGTRCPPPDQAPCDADPATCAECVPCFAPADLDHGRPSTEQLEAKLPWFLESAPSASCAKGGLGAYDDVFQRDAKTHSRVAGLDEGVVAASTFRTNYVTLSSQADFINAMQKMRAFASDAGAALDLDMYSYSIFHVFFEQYLTIGRDAVLLLGSAGIAVFLICWLALGSLGAALLIAAILAMIEIDLLGVMAIWGIQMNAVSLVNLAMALGIGVEFCAHIVHSFMVTPGDRRTRAAAALTDVGAAVLSGITLTKFVGVVVLAFARTQIFEVYYFRMFLALVLLGAAHGLVLLPVLLSLVGPTLGSGASRRGRNAAEEARVHGGAAVKSSTSLSSQ